MRPLAADVPTISASASHGPPNARRKPRRERGRSAREASRSRTRYNVFMNDNLAKNDLVLLGIDIGGTAVKFGVLDAAGRVLSRSTLATRDLTDRASQRAFALAIADLLPPGVEPARVDAVGCAVPGAVDDQGRIGLIPNASIDADGLMSALADAFPSSRIATLNDANAAALGEQWLGAGAGVASVLMVTLGTGIGAGVIAGSRVLGGAHGCAGEIGHLCVERRGRACSCGATGCLEQYASARGLVRTMIEESEPAAFHPAHDADAAAVFSALEAGDVAARRAVDRFCETLAFGLAAAACTIDPHVILIGGGVSESFDLFARKLRRDFARFAIPPCKSTPIEKARLGNDAGFMGAARFAHACLLGPSDRAERKDVQP